ncbi:MAG: hypothetical protein ACYTF3_00750 [Planctomycetota bacterium]
MDGLHHGRRVVVMVSDDQRPGVMVMMMPVTPLLGPPSGASALSRVASLGPPLCLTPFCPAPLGPAPLSPAPLSPALVGPAGRTLPLGVALRLPTFGVALRLPPFGASLRLPAGAAALCLPFGPLPLRLPGVSSLRPLAGLPFRALLLTPLYPPPRRPVRPRGPTLLRRLARSLLLLARPLLLPPVGLLGLGLVAPRPGIGRLGRECAGDDHQRRAQCTA